MADRIALGGALDVRPMTLDELRQRAAHPPPPADMASPLRQHRPADPILSTADLGPVIRSAREAMGLSQQRFADLAGVGRRFISELENGKASLEFDRVLQVCRAAGIDILAKRRSAR